MVQPVIKTKRLLFRVKQRINTIKKTGELFSREVARIVNTFMGSRKNLLKNNVRLLQIYKFRQSRNTFKKKTLNLLVPLSQEIFTRCPLSKSMRWPRIKSKIPITLKRRLEKVRSVKLKLPV